MSWSIAADHETANDSEAPRCKFWSGRVLRGFLHSWWRRSKEKNTKQCLALWMAERRASKSDRNWIAEASARSLLKQQIFGTVEQRRATISQLYGLGPKGRGWGQGPGRSRLSGRLVSFAIASPANRDHGADICPSPPSLWHLAVCPYRPLEFVILGTTDAAHKMVCHFRHRHTLGQSERRWFNIGADS